jgi:hypothetical protein
MFEELWYSQREQLSQLGQGRKHREVPFQNAVGRFTARKLPRNFDLEDVQD